MRTFVCITLLLLLGFSNAQAASDAVAVVENKSCSVLVKDKLTEEGDVSLVILVIKKRITSRPEMTLDLLAVRINRQGLLLGGYIQQSKRSAPSNFLRDVVTYEDLRWLDEDPQPWPNRRIEKELIRHGESCKEDYAMQFEENFLMTKAMRSSLVAKLGR